MEMHPIVRIVTTFIQEIKGSVRNESDLIEIIFSFLINNVTDKQVQNELGKDVMRLQFPNADDDTLLKMWQLAVAASDPRQRIGGTVASVLVFVRKSKEAEIQAAKEKERERRGIEEKNREKAEQKKILDSTLEFLNLRQRAFNVLTGKGNVRYVGELVSQSSQRLLKIPGMGRNSMNEIQEALGEHDLYLEMDLDGWTPPSKEDGSPLVGDALG